jgi:hypothetical protein
MKSSQLREQSNKQAQCAKESDVWVDLNKALELAVAL